MATTSNFDKWLEQIDFKEGDYEDIFSLYCSIKFARPYGRFNCVPDPVNGGKLISPFSAEDTLLLATENAEAAFLRLLRYRYCGELDLESWHSLRSNLAKQD